MTLEVDVLTLFPSMIAGPLSESIPGRIQERGLAVVRIHDLREFGLGRHRSVDDTPYGGGAGMVSGWPTESKFGSAIWLASMISATLTP